MQRHRRTPLPARRRRRVRVRPGPGHQCALYLADEKTVVSELLALARLPDAEREAIRQDAVALVVAARGRREGKTGIESFLQQYGLASQEGVVLMCLAEALLRIPDADTADKLIADKIAIGQWSDYLGEADSLFVNASTWGLMLTGKLVRESELEIARPGVVPAPPGRAARRAGGAHGLPPGDAHHGPPVRDGPRHRRGARARRIRRGRALPAHLRHARRVGADRARMRCATSSPIAPRSRRSGARCARAARPPAGRASRSSCRRCIRATSTGAQRQVLAELGPRLEIARARGASPPASR